MKISRDLSGDELASLLRRYGYEITRHTFSHMRLTTIPGGEHHITIPGHKSLRVGTLNSILKDIAEHFAVEKEELVETLFEK